MRPTVSAASDRVERRKHEVARLGRLQRGLCGLGVAELADQNRVRVMTEGAPKRLAEGLFEPDLALVDDAAAIVCRISIGSSIVRMCCFRVRFMKSIIAASVVVFPSRRAGDEDQPAVLPGEVLHADRHVELLEARHGFDHAESERGRAALAISVDAEARQEPSW
jgi:hypothetical protein